MNFSQKDIDTSELSAVELPSFDNITQLVDFFAFNAVLQTLRNREAKELKPNRRYLCYSTGIDKLISSNKPPVNIPLITFHLINVSSKTKIEGGYIWLDYKEGTWVDINPAERRVFTMSSGMNELGEDVCILRAIEVTQDEFKQFDQLLRNPNDPIAPIEQTL